MLSRRDVLSKAADDCMKELYTFVQPAVTWDCFIAENKVYNDRYNEWKDHENPEWEGKSINECIGPRPYEFYYLPENILKKVVSSYIYAYRIDKQEELLNTIEILKKYCEDPIIDKYVKEYTDERGNHHPGYRDYDHPDSITTELCNVITNSNINLGGNSGTDVVNLAQQCWDKIKEFLDMAGNFYNWNSELNSFNMTIYLGCSHNSNKEAVIENWKKYRNADIEIDESKWNEEEYD